MLTLTAAATLQPARGPLGTEIAVPEFTDYAEVELED